MVDERADGFRAGYTAASIDFRSAMTRKRSGHKKILAKVLAATIAIASQLFMGFVFFNEAFLGHGVLFYEPNLAIATGEFITVALGTIGMSWVTWRLMDE